MNLQTVYVYAKNPKIHFWHSCVYFPAVETDRR